MIAKLKSIEKGQRLQYFKDYYLLKCIAIIAFIVFALSLGKDIYNNKKTILNISFVNMEISPEGLTYLKDDFRTYSKINKKNKVVVSYGGQIKYMEDASNAYALSSKLLVGNPDILLADEIGYTSLAFSKPFLNLEEVFKDDEELKEILDKYGVRNKDIDGKETYIDAIDITNTKFGKNYISTNDDSKLYFTVAAGTAHLDYVKKVIKYLGES